MVERLVHEASWRCAHDMLSLVGHLLREEEQREYFAQAYNHSRQAIEQYCLQTERERRRITPSSN